MMLTHNPKTQVPELIPRCCFHLDKVMAFTLEKHAEMLNSMKNAFGLLRNYAVCFL